MKPMYSYRVEPVDVLSMATLKTHRLYRAVILASDGERAAVTKIYPKEGTARLQGARKAKSYEVYYQRTGKRWELELKEKREAEKRVKRIAFLEELIPKLQAELKQLKSR